MESKESFEILLNRHRVAVERYINFRLPSSFDADDVIQETYCAAYAGYDKLRNKDLFKSWILSIAKNQCNLWFRKKYGEEQISIEEIAEAEMPVLRDDGAASEILSLLPKGSADLLFYSAQGYKQKEIAEHLKVPVGTVKSRLHYAKKQFRSMCSPEQITIFERGRKNMPKNDLTCGFPENVPNIVIEKSDRPFFEVKYADEAFIVPEIGNRNSEGTYRYPDGKLALVSTCYVPKAASIHDIEGVKICRDTYNVGAGKLFKNEKIWFTQLTDEYIRNLATIIGDCEDDDSFPTVMYTFLEEDYDVIVNGKDRVHGRPLRISENPAKIVGGNLVGCEYNVRYTLGSFNVIVGTRTFGTVCFINVQDEYTVTENYVDKNGRLVLLRTYEAETDAKCTPKLSVNGVEYFLTEDRISQYSL